MALYLHMTGHARYIAPASVTEVSASLDHVCIVLYCIVDATEVVQMQTYGSRTTKSNSEPTTTDLVSSVGRMCAACI